MRAEISTWFGRQSLAHKLTGAIIMTCGVTLTLPCVVFAIDDYSSSRAKLVRDVITLADVIGSNSTAALAFRDVQAANETLKAVGVNDHITSARLFTGDGQLLAAYLLRSGPTFQADQLRQPKPLAVFEGGRLRVLRPVIL